MTPAELARRAGLPADAVGAQRLVERTRDVAVGDRMLVHDVGVVEVVALVVMSCGCSRAAVTALGWPRTAHLFSDGCRWAQDTVDFASAGEAV